MIAEDRLERSSVVANNAMNRERNLAGPNSYAKDLGFSPLDIVGDGGAWLDLCCGRGRALIQAARPGRVLVGVDLVDHFDPHDASVTLVAAPLREWEPPHAFDLVTCVHGLHYLGDKLGALARALTWVRPGGRFAAHLDPANVKGVDARAWLRGADVEYDARRRLVRCDGPRQLEPPRYVGADDRAGPNFTGQPAVDSYYEL